MNELIKKLAAVEHGFRLFELEAQEIVNSHTMPEAKVIAIDWLKHDLYQVRSCAVFILGFIAGKDKEVLPVLRDKARSDGSWQVQEMIAKAFDQYCKDIGYEKALPEIREWLDDQHPNVCRAVTEGLRTWTGRPYFKTHPQVAVQLISRHKASDSEYLRKSVGNALRDISKKYADVVVNEIAAWDLSDKRIAYTHAYVLKKH